MTENGYNQYGIRQVGERVRLPGMSIAVSEKKRDDGSTVRWAQLSKYNPKNDEWINFSVFPDDLDLLQHKIPELLPKLKETVPAQ
jgi:hypothetical protein